MTAFTSLYSISVRLEVNCSNFFLSCKLKTLVSGLHLFIMLWKLNLCVWSILNLVYQSESQFNFLRNSVLLKKKNPVIFKLQRKVLLSFVLKLHAIWSFFRYIKYHFDKLDHLVHYVFIIKCFREKNNSENYTNVAIRFPSTLGSVYYVVKIPKLKASWVGFLCIFKTFENPISSLINYFMINKHFYNLIFSLYQTNSGSMNKFLW